MVAQARKRIAAERATDRARPIGERRLDIGFYDKSDRDRPVSDGSMMRNGKVIEWKGARWAVWRVRWTGDRWQQYRRLSGPLQYPAALDRLGEDCKRLNLRRTTD